MNKEQERSDAIHKALKAQADHFYGESGSAKRSAQRLQSAICPQGDLRAVQDKVQIMGKIPMDADADTRLQESYKRSVIRRLEDSRSDFFSQLTEMAAALEKYDSGFFRQIADGLDELKQVDVLSLDIMRAIHQVYLAWMGASLYDWTLLPYKAFVKKRIPPTKQQMRELTIRHWAMMRLFRQGDISLMQCIVQQEQSPEVEELIRQQSAKLPTQNWKRFWKKSGLANLQVGKAGRPRNK
jgi:hypothetical protein